VSKCRQVRSSRESSQCWTALRDAKEEFIVIAFAEYGGETMAFPLPQVLAATEEILTDNGVRSQGSSDMLAVWNVKRSRESRNAV
jgi:hypothetical protein